MEFGSDFHICHHISAIHRNYLPDNANLYYSGRQAIEAVLLHIGCRKLWAPAYFCHESLDRIMNMGIEVAYYHCTPESNPDEVIKKLPVKPTDAILRMNYFGRFGFHDSEGYGCAVIEDHSHDLLGEWASNSNADWCIASLRKTLPIPDGGILWSPKGYGLPPVDDMDPEPDALGALRYEAMAMKTKYIAGEDINKQEFLEQFRKTEEMFDTAGISHISKVSASIIGSMDILEWYSLKKKNYEALLPLLKLPDDVEILPMTHHAGTPFSLVLLFGTQERRDRVRKELISRSVYPAILWSITENMPEDVVSFGDRMLSIHCDARYTTDQMPMLADIINQTIEITP